MTRTFEQYQNEVNQNVSRKAWTALSFWDETQLRLLSTHNLLSQRAFAKTTQLKIIETNKATTVFNALHPSHKNNYFNFTNECHSALKYNFTDIKFWPFRVNTHRRKKANDGLKPFYLISSNFPFEFRREKHSSVWSRSHVFEKIY